MLEISGMYLQELNELHSADHRILNPVQLLVIFFIIQPLGPALNYLSDYRSIHYWPSQALPVALYGHFPVRIPFMLIEYYISAMSFFGIGFYIFMALIYVNSFTAASKILL
jgi:hypothetical protein